MSTDRLYYDQPDLLEFDAEVSAAQTAGGRAEVVLNRTAFYPTSGGQVFDTGCLEAGTARWRVVEVRDAEDGSIVHVLEGPAAPEKGSPVHGRIDESRRRDHMQQHSGQHVLSAVFLERFRMPTVSFHMGDESCTIDLETKSLNEEQVQEAERLANETVTRDIAVTIRYATPEEARGLGVRKIPPDIRERLRLIDIAGVDLTACGGTHVARTGQIGPILLRGMEKVKQGMRVEFVCGQRAVATARRDFVTLTEAAAAFSSHLREVPRQVRKLAEDGKAAVKQQSRLLAELAEFWAERLLAEAEDRGGWKLVRRIFAERDLSFIKLVALKLAAKPGVVALLGCGAGQAGMVLAQSPGLSFDMGALMKESVAAAGGRGGGTRDMAQGGLPDPGKLEAALATVAAKLA